jgi:hypothetical protein
VIEVLGGDQLEDGVAQVLEPLVVRRTAFGMLVVIGAMRQRLPQQGDVMEANAQCPLELL